MMSLNITLMQHIKGMPATRESFDLVSKFSYKKQHAFLKSRFLKAKKVSDL